MTPNIHFKSYLALFFLEQETFQTKIAEDQNIYFIFSNFS